MDLFPATKKDDGNAPPAPAPDDPAAGVIPSFGEALARRTWLLSLAGPVSALAGFGTWYITYLIFERSYHGDLAQGDEPGLRALVAGILPATVAAASGMFIVFTGIVAKSSRMALGGVYIALALGAISWLMESNETALMTFALLIPPLCTTLVCWMAGVKRPWKPGGICGASGEFVAMGSLFVFGCTFALVLDFAGLAYSVNVGIIIAVLAALGPPYLGAWIFFHTLRRGCFTWRGLDPAPSGSESGSVSSEER